jgi:hypothetical protein
LTPYRVFCRGICQICMRSSAGVVERTDFHFGLRKIHRQSWCQRTMVNCRTFATESRPSHSLVNERRQTHTRRVIDPPNLTPPLRLPRLLPAQNQILRSDRRRQARIQIAVPHSVGKQTSHRGRCWPHVRIMPDSAADRRRYLSTTPCCPFFRATGTAL